MAGQVDPDDAVRFGELFGLLPPELAGGRKAVDENQRKPLTGDAYERVAYRHVSRRHHSCCCGHSCAPSTYAAVRAHAVSILRKVARVLERLDR